VVVEIDVDVDVEVEVDVVDGVDVVVDVVVFGVVGVLSQANIAIRTAVVATSRTKLRVFRGRLRFFPSSWHFPFSKISYQKSILVYTTMVMACQAIFDSSSSAAGIRFSPPSSWPSWGFGWAFPFALLMLTM